MVVVLAVVVIVVVVVPPSYGDSDIERAESFRVAKGLQQAMQAYTPSNIQLPPLFSVFEIHK